MVKTRAGVNWCMDAIRLGKDNQKETIVNEDLKFPKVGSFPGFWLYFLLYSVA